MLEYTEIHHVSLNVSNIEQARTFYKDVLCLQEISRPNFGFPGAWFAIQQQQLHLIEMPESQTIRKDKSLSSREGHVAFRVKNYQTTLDWLQQKGVDILEKPNNKSGFSQIFCADPDGNLIELNVEQDENNHK